ncbi:lipid storage droplets surface-binding protein 2-like isoform X1 [Cylas formicarius]|uniref:lipid storage droplets surface-binding protein 2-like isoform X1 n=1 Tax=Cylas formicarius TaxID=197179 RepID=UPI0029586766|nr:lipid storage droplets surface-binding protein 2-like isoform X1 [Cylas formicarius]
MSVHQDNENSAVTVAPHPTCMESVNRIAKLPVVESTIQTATNIYEKVKDYNSVTNWTLSTAENTVHKAVEISKPITTPVMKNLEGPIKKVDGVLCTGLDYVESKVPAVKLPPKELILQIYNSTKEYVDQHVTPTVESAYAYAEPAVKTARNLVEPAVEKVRNVVEPVVEPVVENVKHKVEEYLHRGSESTTQEEHNSSTDSADNSRNS